MINSGSSRTYDFFRKMLFAIVKRALAWMATVGATRLQRAGRSRSERLRLQWHACANGRTSCARLLNASYCLPRRWVPGDRPGGRHRARTCPELPAHAYALPEMQSACASQIPETRLYKGTEVGSEEYVLPKYSNRIFSNLWLRVHGRQ